jgi:predicted AlkP superfamily pyrophosphatase or phosphodiesterase
LKPPSRRTRAALLSSLVLGLGSVGAARQSPSPAAAGRPRLLLFVSVDQMRFDYLTRFAPLFKAGFRRLLDQGAVFTNARYRHANTETGPGHSVLLSGRSPCHSGIVANRWFDALLGDDMGVVEDATVTAVGGSGPAASPANFIGFTLGDVLKKASPASKVVGVSLKDRSAILMAGPRADAAYWYDGSLGRFVTSTYYARNAPAWLEAWNGKRLAESAAFRTWPRLLPDEGLYRRYAGEDAVKGEWDNKDTVFPHRVRGTPPSAQYFDDLRRTPFVDELTLDFALEAMAAHGLGEDDATDVLAVGFSATDIIGHTYGPDSQEAMDQLLRLDLVLGRLLDEVERRVGPGRLLMGLSADHASMPLVEVLQARGVAARRVRPAEVEAPVTRALEARFGAGPKLVARFYTPDVYLDLKAIEARGLKRHQVEQVVESALLGTGLIDKVYTQADLLGDRPTDDPYFPLVRRSFFQARSPHVIAVQKPWIYLDDRVGGTGHGTPHDYDRHVPVAFLGAGVRAGSYPAESGPEDIAPTLAALLRLDYPLQDAERVLSEAVR